jgi:hypothetical protein
MVKGATKYAARYPGAAAILLMQSASSNLWRVACGGEMFVGRTGELRAEQMRQHAESLSDQYHDVNDEDRRSARRLALRGQEVDVVATFLEQAALEGEITHKQLLELQALKERLTSDEGACQQPHQYLASATSLLQPLAHAQEWALCWLML